MSAKTLGRTYLKTCDLCGRRIKDRHGKPYKFAIWCLVCMKRHTIYPIPCETCNGEYHFSPGVTTERST